MDGSLWPFHPLSLRRKMSRGMMKIKYCTLRDGSNTILLLTILLVGLFSTSTSVQESPRHLQDEQPPNLLFFIVDQMRYDELHFLQQQMERYQSNNGPRKPPLLIQTPNLDKLAQRGVTFSHTYTASPQCVPSRACLLTGTSLQRNGLLSNGFLIRDKKTHYSKMDIFQQRVQNMTTVDQYLAQHLHYTVEYYGKLHMRDPSPKAIRYNFYDFERDEFYFSNATNLNSVGQPLPRHLKYLNERDYGISKQNYSLKTGEKLLGNMLPYQASPTLDGYLRGSPGVVGTFSHSKLHTPTSALGETAVLALQRLLDEQKTTRTPFALFVSFRMPHQPWVAAKSYADYYLRHKDHLVIPTESLQDPMNNSAYQYYGARLRILMDGWENYKLKDANVIAELTALHYALVQEIDHWIGEVLQVLEASEKGFNNTMIVFTSDHGEMLGAHALLEKRVLLEESVRVPLIMSFPGYLPETRIVQEPVSHLDVVPTIWDYLNVLNKDERQRDTVQKSFDGTSLRRWIENKSTNQEFDEHVVVSEYDQRSIRNSQSLVRQLETTHMLVHRNTWKLITSKRDKAGETFDMLYNLRKDPNELDNLLGALGKTASNDVIGKAEHLKILLLEWMQRNDRQERFYSDSRWDLGGSTGDEHGGDMGILRKRRTWREVDYWVSDESLVFGDPTYQKHDGMFTQNEYLYFGRTMVGRSTISNLRLTGEHRDLFTICQVVITDSRGGGDSGFAETEYTELLNSLQLEIEQYDFVRVKICLATRSLETMLSLQTGGVDSVLEMEVDRDSTGVSSSTTVAIPIILEWQDTLLVTEEIDSS